ncbi:MAG TPA: glutamine--fructose-6-phosphate aminotransferase, partial [Planctomycetaceae bacterium]|nr:glutamine--fructose-6-phosphate aminotransferase [Planctomycetaceae bacterium]
MCGIVAYRGTVNAAEVLIPALKRLEYRGYDSAGLCIATGGELFLRKDRGTISSIEAGLTDVGGTVGVAHTRWATHGRPSRANAHPHTDCHDRIALVHNGIIENYQRLREE